jgi:hypothetical protein
MAISFVPPPDEEHPILAVAKIGGLTAVLLLGGAALYAAGNIRSRRLTGHLRAAAFTEGK